MPLPPVVVAALLQRPEAETEPMQSRLMTLQHGLTCAELAAFLQLYAILGAIERLRVLALCEALALCHKRPDVPALISLLRRMLVLRAPEPWIDADDKNVVEANDACHSTSDLASARYQTMLCCLDTLVLIDGRMDAESNGDCSPSQLIMGVYTLLDLPGASDNVAAGAAVSSAIISV